MAIASKPVDTASKPVDTASKPVDPIKNCQQTRELFYTLYTFVYTLIIF